MSESDIGTIIDIQVVPYDVRKVPTIDASNSWSPYNLKNIIENCQDIKETLIIHIQDNSQNALPLVERITDVGITSSWFNAIDCLTVGLYDPSVLLASISVECVLNHDLRLESYRQIQLYKWIDLNWKNLKHAYDNGLPTDLLLKTNETFATGNIEFVSRRNKVAHGDTEGYSNMYPGGFMSTGFTSTGFNIGHSRPSKQHAIEQIEIAKKFIIEWAKQRPQVRIH